MTLFVIIDQSDDGPIKLSNAVARAYPNDLYNLGNGAWIVSDKATAKDVSDKVGISEGENGSAVIVEVASYFGRTNPATWSWMKTKWEAGASG